MADKKPPFGKDKKVNDKSDKKKDEPDKIAGKGTDSPSKFIDITPTIDYTVKTTVVEWIEKKRKEYVK